MRFDARQRGLSKTGVIWIVVGVIAVGVAVAVIVSMVAVVVPKIQEQQSVVKSQDNVKTLVTFIMMRAQERGWNKYAYSGKNLVLSPLVSGDVDDSDRANLEIFFSPGDTLYTLDMVDVERFGDVTGEALRADDDFHELTSYAGRKMADKKYWAMGSASYTPMLICDDDDGPLHHIEGLLIGSMDMSARFATWEDLGIAQPDPDEPDPFLGEDAAVNQLRAMRGR